MNIKNSKTIVLWRLKSKLLGLSLLFLFYANTITNVNAQNRPAPAAAAPTNAVTTSEGQSEPTGFFPQFIKTFSPLAGLAWHPVIALGALGDKLDAGLAGASLYGDVKVPASIIKITYIPWPSFLEWRAGTSLGFATFSTSSSFARSGDATIVPWSFYSKIVMPLNNVVPNMQLRPYGKLGFGLSFSSSESYDNKGKSIGTANSVDGMYEIGLGSGVRLPQVKNTEFFTEFRFNHLFQNSDGHFLFVMLGAAWQF